MSRYTLLIILNLPLVIAGIMSAVVSFKLGQSGRKRFVFRSVLWLFILAGLVFAEPLYSYLFSHRLTQTEPLSLFDVIQVTGILLVLFLANRAYIKAEVMERRVQDLHQELSIRMSENK